jgi:hypothetical protein
MSDLLPYLTAGAVLLLAAILLIVFLWTFRRSSRSSGRDLQGDLTNMMILFQTMRDMLDQQKELARQLNASVDRKVALIRNVVTAAADAHEELCQAQKALAQTLEDLKRDLDGVTRQLARVPADPPARLPAPHAATPAADAVKAAPVATPPSSEPAPPPPAEEEHDLVDNWVGLDVAEPGPEPSPEGESGEDIAERFFEPTTPEETHAARDAFRMLLNMASAQTPAPPAPSRTGHGNGHEESLLKNRAIIYEYSDAGMSVSDIARELGMGKGEVRLILGLRKEEERTQ